MNDSDNDSQQTTPTSPSVSDGLGFKGGRFLAFVILLVAGTAGTMWFAVAAETERADQKTLEVAKESQRARDSEEKARRLAAANEQLSKRLVAAESKIATVTKRADQQSLEVAKESRRARDAEENAKRLATDAEQLAKRAITAESQVSSKAIEAGELAESRLARSKYLQAVSLYKENRHSKAVKLLESIPQRFRNFEWQYIQNYFRQTRVAFQHHATGIHSITFRPDGEEFAVVGRNGTIYIHDAMTGYEDVSRRIKGHKSAMAVWSPNGEVLANARWSAIEFYNYKSGELIKTVKTQAGKIAFASNNDTFFATDKDQVTAWSFKTGKQLWKVPVEGSRFFAIALSHDDRQLAIGDQKGQIILYDAKSGEEQFRYHRRCRIDWLEYNPDDSMLAIPAGREDRNIGFIDPETGKEIRQIPTGSHWVTDLQFSPSGGQLLTGGDDSLVNLWDVETGTLLKTFAEHNSSIEEVCWNPDGTEFVSADPDGKVRISMIDPGDQEIVYDDGAPVLGISVRKSDGQVASGNGRNVEIRDATGKMLRSLTGDSDYVQDLTYSPDGKLLASAVGDGSIDVWDPDSGEHIQLLEKHKGIVKSVAFTADSTRVVSGGLDETVKVWSVDSGKLLHTLKGHGHRVYDVDCSPDGKLIASAAWDRTLCFWDTETGKKLHKARPKKRQGASSSSKRYTSLAFSPDGNYVAAGTHAQEIYFFDAKTGHEKARFRGHDRGIISLAFNPDGSRLASGSTDQTVRLWDTSTLEEIHTFKGHTRYVEAVRFSADGSKLYSGSRDSTVRVWDATDHDWTIDLEDREP